MSVLIASASGWLELNQMKLDDIDDDFLEKWGNQSRGDITVVAVFELAVGGDFIRGRSVFPLLFIATSKCHSTFHGRN